MSKPNEIEEKTVFKSTRPTNRRYKITNVNMTGTITEITEKLNRFTKLPSNKPARDTKTDKKWIKEIVVDTT